MVVRSYPDSGYFVIWQDYRNDQSSYNDEFSVIYAQKYDKTGTQLWATNGVPVTASPNNDHFTYSGQTYRSRSFAATDSAGGFYITYADDSVTNYVYQRVCVQHIHSDGSRVFPGAGNIIASSTVANFNVSPQLIPDGNKGFFLSFMRTAASVFIYGYKDVNGTLQNYGGGMMNENALQVTASSPCGNYTYLQYPDANVLDYSIFSDLQGGCNIIMNLSANGSGVMVGYNKLWRAKSNSVATQYVRGLDYSTQPYPISYQKDNVYRLYYLSTDHQEIRCGSNPNVYVVNQYRLVQNGFQVVDAGATLYDLNYPKGTTVATTGNINATILGMWERTYSASTGVSAPIVKAYGLKEEIYDSIPYQRTSFNNPDYPGYNTTEPATLNKLNNFRDTLLAGQGGSYFDFSLAGGGNQVYSAALITENNLSLGYRNLRLQHLAVETAAADSFAVVYKTDVKGGVIIGVDQQNYSYGGQYDFPLFTVNRNGNALFYIKENSGNSGPARVSPIFNGAELAWGAMGKQIGTGVWNGSYYDISSPVVSLDPVNGTALMSWTDSRNVATTGIDIYMRHLDNLNDPSYEPPYKRIRAVPNPYGPTISTAMLLGTSKKFSTFDAFSSYGTDPGVSPVADISDNYNLGKVTVSTYENTGGIRSYNGKPYLDRSFTITPEHNPNGAATITIRLMFTTAQFNALKAADPSIRTPGDLAVIKQPSGSGATYSVVAGEQTVIPQSWAAVAGGYYIEIQITSFSNFFIFKNLNIPLPLKWLGIGAEWQNATQAKVSWQVTEQQNVQNYTVQYSPDGISFTDACTVTADPAQTQYSCIVPSANDKNYYRVAETDIDGRKTYSRIVLLRAGVQPELTLYPNPAHDVLYVDGLAKYKSVQIADANGKIVLRQTIVPPMQSININHLAAGIYTLTVTRDNDSKTIKFIKN